MSQTEIIIVEERNRVGTTNMFKTLGLYLNGNKVIFRAYFSSPEPSDVSYSVFYEIDIDDYRKGIEKLRKDRRCELEGLIITTTPDGGGVNFNTYGKYGPYSSPKRSSFGSNWTIDQISLPGTPMSCQAKEIVPNIYEGKPWG